MFAVPFWSRLLLVSVVWHDAVTARFPTPFTLPSCSMQPGIAFHASPTYQTVNTSTAAACCAACAADLACTGFTFQESHLCHLKHGHAFNGSTHKDCTSGTFPRPSGCPAFNHTPCSTDADCDQRDYADRPSCKTCYCAGAHPPPCAGKTGQCMPEAGAACCGETGGIQGCNYTRLAPWDRSLPQLLMMGDSISLGMRSDVAVALHGKMQVTHIPVNSLYPSTGVRCADKWLGPEPQRWDHITLGPWHGIGNCTLPPWHGTCDSSDPDPSAWPAHYVKLLANLTTFIHAHTTRADGHKAVLHLLYQTPVCSTTSCCDASLPNGGHCNAVISAYNHASMAALGGLGVRGVDLFSTVNKVCSAPFSTCNISLCNNSVCNVHFNAGGWAILASEVARAVASDGSILGSVLGTPPSSSRSGSKTTSRSKDSGSLLVAKRRAVVRIRTLQTDFAGSQSLWMLQAKPGSSVAPDDGLCHSPATACEGFTAPAVLRMIEELRPTQLERFVSGRQNMSALVPVAVGAARMTVRDFLDACQQRLAPGGQITARISLNHFCCGRSMCPHCDTEPTNCCRPNATTTASFLAIAHDMLAAGATLAVPWTTLGIDNWSGACKGSPPVPQATVRALLLALRAQGWAHLAVNEVGKFCNSFGLVDTAEFGIDNHALAIEKRLVPDYTTLKKIKDAGITNANLYIDFPSQYEQFNSLLSVDERADALLNMSLMQREHNFTFVFPVLQGHCAPFGQFNGTLGSCSVACDTTRAMTSASGRYGGLSLYDIIRKELA